MQAQFLISPDHVFTEKGVVSKIDYRDRFKQYKKLIIKNIDSPQMKILMTRFNAQLLKIHSQDDQTPSACEQSDSEDEDCFSRAFQEKVVLSTSLSLPPSTLTISEKLSR